MEFNLKAVEIYEKEFTRSKKDKEFYSIQEVNDYLDLIIEDYQKFEKLAEKLTLLEEENNNLKSEIAELRGEELAPVEATPVDHSVEKLPVNTVAAAVVTDNLVKENTSIQSTNEAYVKEDVSGSEIVETEFEELNESTVVETIENEEIQVNNIEILEDNSDVQTNVNNFEEESVVVVDNTISHENTTEGENTEQKEVEVVESLSIDDIAEIRRLLQEERAALYNRNEE